MEFLSLKAKIPEITKRTSPGIAKMCTTKNSATPQPINKMPEVLGFFILNADINAAIFTAAIKNIIRRAPPITNPKMGIPIMWLI